MPSDRSTWQFKIPTLPKRVYVFVKEFSESEDVSYWHLILMAIRLLSRLPEEERATLKAEILKKYPYPGSESCR